MASVEAHRIEALAIWTELTKRKPGNPNRDEKSGRLAPSVDNVHDRPERPTGTSAEAGLRRLAKEVFAEIGEMP